MKNLISRTKGYVAEIRRRRLWMRMVMCLACVVVFCTTYALILPAITMETSEFEPDGHVHTDECYQIIKTDAKTELVCPLEIHTHTEDCYDAEKKLICGYADFVVHTHDSLCYDADGNLVCRVPEIKAHTHTEDCWSFGDGNDTEMGHIHTDACYTVSDGELLCGLEESASHSHDENCYMEMDELVCGQEESEEHIHNENCYKTVSQLICPFEESEGHQHTDACYGQGKALTCGLEEGHPEVTAFFSDAEAEPVCGMKEIVLHTHCDTCYNDEGERICGQLEVLEHQHTEECLHITEASEERILDCPYASSEPEKDTNGADGSSDDEATEEVDGADDSSADEEKEDIDGADGSPEDEEKEDIDEADGSSEDEEKEDIDKADENSDDIAKKDNRYFYEGDTVTVEVILENQDELPAGAELTVRAVTDVTEGYDYELLKEQTEEVVGRQAAQIDFYDISFYTQDGEYIPVTDNATVTLHYKTGFLADAYEVNVLHCKADNDEPELLESVMGADDNGINELTFRTEGFSVFAVMTLAEEETAEPAEEGTFTLKYNDYTITFKLVDFNGKTIPGDYTQNNIIAQGAARYIFGSNSSSTAESGTVVYNVAPAVDGYTYIGATKVKTDNGSKIWAEPVYSAAVEGYPDGYGTFSGFRFYTSEPLASDKYLSWNEKAYTVTLTYAKNADNLDNKTFAIINRANGDYALTASEGTVNNVKGLESQGAAVVKNGTGYQVTGDVTKWTFHRQENGTYIISTTIQTFEGGQEEQYLRLCEQSYQDLNDGRGSLTLTEEVNNASPITVVVMEDGSVIMKNGLSCINLDNGSKKFWCFNGDGSYSRFYLCDSTETIDFSGSWVIVNKKGTNSTGIAMQGSGIDGNESANRAGLSVTVRQEANGAYTVLNNDATLWQFEKQENGTYYISTVTGTDATEEKKYLTIGKKNNDPVILSNTPQPITVTPGTGNYSGMVRLTNSDGMAVNLFDGNANQGFGSWNDSKDNEWHTLCRRNYDVVRTTANHPSSVINLFDYWVTEKNDPDNKASDLNAGINKGHNLKFICEQKAGGYNEWTGNAGVYQNIVNKTLSDGYPVLAVGGGKSLNYLFDPRTENAFRESHRNVSGLLQVDSQGYYYYNSAENFAEYNEAVNSFTLYDTWGVTKSGTSPDGQFFPFNSMDEVVNVSSKNSKINHYLGLTLTTRFVQQYGGHTTSSRSADTVFNFAGDDDVWIFIDDVLVADLGGIHDRSSVSIDFATGEVIINANTAYEKVTTLKDQFDAAQAAGEWNGNTFSDNTYHTLKFFYLERGNTDSNLYLQYNLTEIPLTAIYKVNQYGVSVEGAKFAVYKADENYNYDAESKPEYEGVTDAKGEMVFKDDDGMPYSLSELKRMFGNHFVLKETEAPENYSIVSDEIHLYIENGLLLCENTYDSGVWASSNLQVAAPGTLKNVKGEDIPYYDLGSNSDSNGTLFAVVLKYMGNGTEGLTKQSNWSPLYGSDQKGYTVVDPGGDFIGTAIEVAKLASYYGNVCFSLSASGAMQLEMKNLPGDVRNYYYMLDNDHKGNTQYTIAYYWTSANSLDGANSQNTIRVEADDVTYPFDRVFGATIEVPNLINRLFAQKLNEDGEMVNGAKFALYEVKEKEEKKGEIYYKATDNKTLIQLQQDTDGDNRGKAVLENDTAEYVYVVDSDTGVITVSSAANDGGTTRFYTINPYEIATTLDAGSALNPSHEDGTATFSGIHNGTYYMREIAVPTGYLLNPTEVMVLVAEDAVYANAGTEEDGITVARGPGYLVTTMSKFASDGDIDNTLRWVYERMRISNPDAISTFSAYENKDWKTWNYLKENDTGETVPNTESGKALTTYLEYAPDSSNAFFNYTINVNRYTDVRSVRRRLYTTAGWTYYELYQDYDYGVRASGNANYTKLVNDDGSPQEIAHLFSRSTYIRVTDKKMEGDLEISKIVKNASVDSGDSYRFKVVLENAGGTPLTGSYSYKIYSITADTADDGTTSISKGAPVTDEDGNAISRTVQSGDSISLKAHQIVVIENLPAGTRYTITEEAGDQADYIISAVRDRGKVSVGAGTGNMTFAQNEVKGTLYWKVDENGDVDTTSTVDYTNTYLSDLTIHKVDSTNRNVSLSGAKFVLYKMDSANENWYYSYTEDSPDGSSSNTGETSWNKLSDGKTEEDYGLTTDSYGKFSLYQIEDGTYFLKELSAPAGYYPLTSPITVTVKDGKLVEKDYGNTGITISGNSLILTIPNSSGYELPSTGGSGTLLYTICGIALMAGPLMYIFHRRRKGECDAL